MNNFSEKGFLIIRNAVNLRLIRDIQKLVIKSIKSNNRIKKNEKNNYKFFCKAVENIKVSEFNFLKPIYNLLLYKGIIEKYLFEKKLYKSISEILGYDLSYCNDQSLVLNVPKLKNSKGNYLFKDWHQEIWSGSGTASINVWTPIFQKNSSYGQIELAKESHKWGHIPHRGRKPLELPEKYKTIQSNLKYGDVIIFSTLTLHRSLPTRAPRLALGFQVRNFRFKDYSYENNRNWKIFSYSEITKIELISGNHYLSPYRTIHVNSDYFLKSKK